jgi:hypothetical protein
MKFLDNCQDPELMVVTTNYFIGYCHLVSGDLYAEILID